jgi:uncharacterized protein (TIGR00661 family)
LDNDNLNIYYDQIKSYSPDLIISDLEYFTSYIANSLNIRLWQYSSSLLDYALASQEKYNLGLHKFFAHSLKKTSEKTQSIFNLLHNSERNFVCSHYGDTNYPPVLATHFEWIRPYHQLSKPSIPCQHHIVAALYGNKKVLHILKTQTIDTVVFQEQCLEEYPNLQVKELDNQEEYYCNLKNCNFFVCQGQASFLADAFYSGKFSLIYPDYHDTESLINSQLSAKFGYGQIMTYLDAIDQTTILPITTRYRSNVKFIDDYIEELAK